MKKAGFFVVFFAVAAELVAQNYYYISKIDTGVGREVTAQTGLLGFPVNMENVKAIGMGNTQIANGVQFNAMMYNPALLGTSKKSFEVFGFQMGMPPATYDAAFFLLDHMDEFEEAVSLTQVLNGVKAFHESGSSDEKIDALNQIQDGLQFSLDLVSEVIGDTDDPDKHGVTVLPSVAVQYGNWGFALYGVGQSGFLVQQSRTIDALLAVDIPSNLDNPVQAAKSVAQVLGILSTVVLEGGESFANEVFPVAFHLSYMDIVGTLGYGFQLKNNWQVGANIKVINRRMATDRIAVIDYDEILSKAWDNLQSSVTGVTLDLGGLYQSAWGTRFGLSLQNVVPISSIEQQIDFHFRIPRVYYDKEGGNYMTNEQGDTALVSTYHQVAVHKPFSLETPFIANLGIYHPVTEHWDVALDWVDMAEQDTRYEKTFDRLRIGTEYRFHMFHDHLVVAVRSGMADMHFSCGIGFQIYRYVHLDGAYAYNRFVKTGAYYAQLMVGW